MIQIWWKVSRATTTTWSNLLKKILITTTNKTLTPMCRTNICRCLLANQIKLSAQPPQYRCTLRFKACNSHWCLVGKIRSFSFRNNSFKPRLKTNIPWKLMLQSTLTQGCIVHLFPLNNSLNNSWTTLNSNNLCTINKKDERKCIRHTALSLIKHRFPSLTITR